METTIETTAYACKVAGCNYAGKNQGALNLHTRKHTRKAMPKVGEVTPLKPVQEAQSSEQVTSSTRVFYSPKALSMVITVRPEYWGVKTTPSGDISQKVEGKYVQFEGGRFATEDPEIITYIETKYKDPRFPILSDRQIVLKKERV